MNRSSPLARDARMKSLHRMALVALMACAAGGAHAAEAYASYDNFDGATRLDPGRWLFGDRQRLIKGAALSMIQRDHGMQVGDSGTLNQSWGHDVDDPEAITQMRASLTVNDFLATGCAGNPAPTMVQARLAGAFFNVGTTAPTSRVGDVVGVVRLYRNSNSSDGAGVMKVQGIVVQCTTADCNYDQAELGQVDLGTASVGETLSLRMEWDASRNRFSFYRGSDPVQRVTYAVGDAQPPFLPLRQLGTRTNLANCLSGPRTEAFIDAKFDNFAVNQSAAP
jgi:hypothetical protein